MKKNLIRISAAALLAVFLGTSTASAQQMNTDKEPQQKQSSKPISAADRALAAQEFRLGVQSFYRGTFTDALLQFEKALSYLPSENLILDWLGKAYFKLGLEGAAIEQWETASDNGYGGLLLKNRIEAAAERRVSGAVFEDEQRYVDAGSFPGSSPETFYFSQPVSVLPLSDGSCYVLAYGSNELLLFDVNGTIISRTRGPLNGFDRPSDIIMSRSGKLYISEYAGDRISVLDAGGRYISSFGKKGRSGGELLGPQFLAEDSSGNVYVSEFGNSRISVFNSSGEFLFYFGTRKDSFAGFTAPSGICIVDDIVYASDRVLGGIWMFDTAGNYLGVFVPEGTLSAPEALKKSGSFIVAADKNKITAFDIIDGASREIARSGGKNTQLTSAVSDANGSLIVTDFKANEVLVMAPMSELVGGMFVQIERVISNNFPLVEIEVRVENRSRQPVTGLKENNFFITEEKRPAAAVKLVSAPAAVSPCAVTFIVDRSLDSEKYSEAVRSAVDSISSTMKPGEQIRIISAGKVPVTEIITAAENIGSFSLRRLKSPPVKTVSFDLALRLAANDLAVLSTKKAVVYITAGNITPDSFVRYSLSDISAYLNNNGIRFYTVNLEQNAVPEELAYICRAAGGNSFYVYRPEGLSQIVSDIRNSSTGVYRLSYTSILPTDFGRAFLPVEAEVYLHNRSGRDETGYFAPLQ